MKSGSPFRSRMKWVAQPGHTICLISGRSSTRMKKPHFGHGKPGSRRRESGCSFCMQPVYLPNLTAAFLRSRRSLSLGKNGARRAQLAAPQVPRARPFALICERAGNREPHPGPGGETAFSHTAAALAAFFCRKEVRPPPHTLARMAPGGRSWPHRRWPQVLLKRFTS